MAIATSQLRHQLDLRPERTPEPTPQAWVECYWVKRPSGKHEYFRFCYLKAPGDIRSVVRNHIPGGNISSGIAQARAHGIKLAIQCGDLVSAIAARIKTWSAKKPSRRSEGMSKVQHQLSPPV